MHRFSRRLLGAAGIGPFDPYKILGVSPGASKEEIKRAYHRLALRFHPDSGAEGNSERFAAVNEAYEAVKDGKWKDAAQQQQKAGAQSGRGGWDRKRRMYVYEQPGSTTDGYVSGDTEKYLRFFMIGCFLFIFVRVSLFFFLPAKKHDGRQESAPGQERSDGSVPLGSFGGQETTFAPSLANVASGYRSGSVHADEEMEYKWVENNTSTSMKDPLSYR
ncbi:DnaJ domain containing protein, putative [Leishmania lindenbergi]|uniref:DnaJ domain containing protein n=1 Tax=Leishmania lindenbergi TaxID=651832 RepID=A0AAW3A5D0_9TRYP